MATKISVASGKGGVGKSTVSAGIANALAGRGRKVLIIDCDCLCSIDLILATAEKVVYNWADVIMKRCSLFEAVYKSENVSMMACPRDYSEVTLSGFKSIVSALDEAFDYIIFDSPAGTQLGFILACSFADRGLIVSLPDPVSVRSAYFASEKMRDNGIMDIRLIINRVSKLDALKNRILGIDSVIDGTKIQLIGIVPEDKRLRAEAMGYGVYSHAHISFRAFDNIAARLEGEERKLRNF